MGPSDLVSAKNSVKPVDDRHALASHGHQLAFHGLNSGMARKLQCEDFASTDVARVVGFGKLGEGQSAVPQRHR